MKIEQGQGFSATEAKIDSTSLTGTIRDLKMTFGFSILDSSPNSRYSVPLDPTETCRDGKRVPSPDPVKETPMKKTTSLLALLALTAPSSPRPTRANASSPSRAPRVATSATDP